MRPVSAIFDLVYFPKCGVYPIVTGGPWINTFRPCAHIFDFIPCPKGAFIITGDPQLIDGFRPMSRIGDLAYGRKCKFGIIITGSPNFLDL